LLIFLLDAAVWYLFGPLPGFITVCVCWLAATIWLRGRGDGGFGGAVLQVNLSTTLDHAIRSFGPPGWLE